LLEAMASTRDRSVLTPAEQRALAQIRAELDRAVRYDDESIVADAWIRQRYGTGSFATYTPARAAAVRTAWHEAGHAVAALAVGARFSSASIRHCAGPRGTQGRVNGITGGGDRAYVVDAGGQIAERLMDWTLPGSDDDLRATLSAWRRDGGDARRFRQAVAGTPGHDEVAAWRYSEELLTPRRLAVRQVARALLVYPRHLPYRVVAAVAAAA
jgi:hypothetical protein